MSRPAAFCILFDREGTAYSVPSIDSTDWLLVRDAEGPLYTLKPEPPPVAPDPEPPPVAPDPEPLDSGSTIL